MKPALEAAEGGFFLNLAFFRSLFSTCSLFGPELPAYEHFILDGPGRSSEFKLSLRRRVVFLE